MRWRQFPPPDSGNAGWKGEPISADTMGRVHAVLDVTQLRDGLHEVYSRLKRNKALPLNLGLDVAVLDGHEQHASYRRHCAGCRQRTVKTEHGEREGVKVSV